MRLFLFDCLGLLNYTGVLKLLEKLAQVVPSDGVLLFCVYLSVPIYLKLVIENCRGSH